MAVTDPSEAESAPGRPSSSGRPDVGRLAVRALQGGLPFALVVYLGLRSGGYGEVVRGEVGAALWGLVLVGAALGALPLARLGRASWIALGLLAALAAWSALAMIWSESAGRTAAEAARVAMLLGAFALALSVQTRAGLRRAVAGVGAGIAVIGAVALLSRLEPGLFDQPQGSELVAGARARLHYPLGYWNALAVFMAIGIPLLLALGTAARREATRALALAGVPLLALVAYLTLSRGGLIAALAGLAVMVALHPARGALTARAVPAALASGALILAVDSRQALTDGLETPEALAQGDEMLAATLAACALVAALAAWIGRGGYELRLPRPRTPRGRTGRAALGLGAAAVVAGALVAGAGGAVADAWEDFKDPGVPAAGAERFDSASGSGRYQFWSAALTAGRSEPVLGIGPGTYEFFWAREGELPTYIRDAHSLYFEMFAETGVIGLALVLALVASPFALAGRGLGRATERRRTLLAGALGGCAAFAVGAGIDWVWELAVVPAAFLILAAAAIAQAEGPLRVEAPGGRHRGALAALAVAGLAVVAIPTAGAASIESSEADVRAGDLAGALASARTAADLEPWDAAPRLQEALVLERLGEAEAAAEAGREAVRKEPTNWLGWVTLSRLEAAAGNPEEAIAAYRFARALSREFILLP